MHAYQKFLFLLSLLGPLTLAACAGTLGPVMIDGVTVNRLTQEFTGQPYSIRHTDAHPRPGRPSAGLEAAGGSITGSVCGADIQYQVTHHDGFVRVSGFVNNRHSSTLEIREANQIRRIQGSLGNFAVDVLIADDIVAGVVGRFHYRFHIDERENDKFSELVRTQGFIVTMRINGRHELQNLPAAEQAVLVPLMLRCAASKIFENMGHDPPELGFGGAIGAQPPSTINFGS